MLDMRSVLLVTLLMTVPVASVWGQGIGWAAVDRLIESAAPNVPAITTDSLAERLSDSSAVRPVLLDARSAEEYAVSHLNGARRVDPEATSFPELDSLSRETPIVVYCSVGVRSAKIAKRLRDQGYTHAVNLQGSIFRWANQGRPVMREGRPVHAVHPYSRLWGTLLNDDLHAYTPEAASGE